MAAFVYMQYDNTNSRGQQNTCRSQFSSSTIWVLAIKLTPSGLVVSAFTRKENAKVIREAAPSYFATCLTILMIFIARKSLFTLL